jgi:hypothetical protein
MLVLANLYLHGSQGGFICHPTTSYSTGIGGLHGHRTEPNAFASAAGPGGECASSATAGPAVCCALMSASLGEAAARNAFRESGP